MPLDAGSHQQRLRGGVQPRLHHRSGIGGLLIATIGGVNTMWVTAAAFGLSILTIAVLRYRAPTVRIAPRDPRASFPACWRG